MLKGDQFYRISLNILVPSDRFIKQVRELEDYEKFIKEEEGSGYYKAFNLKEVVDEDIGQLLQMMLDILHIIEDSTTNKNFIFTTVCLCLITKKGLVENIETIVVIRRSVVLMKHWFYNSYLPNMKIFLFNLKMETIKIAFLDWSDK